MTKPPEPIPTNSFSFCRALQGLIEIGEDIVDVLDSHTQANHLRGHPDFLLLFGRQLPVRGRCRVTYQGLGIAHVDHSLKEPKSIEALRARLEPAFHSNYPQRAPSIYQISLRHCILVL